MHADNILTLRQGAELAHLKDVETVKHKQRKRKCADHKANISHGRPCKTGHQHAHKHKHVECIVSDETPTMRKHILLRHVEFVVVHDLGQRLCGVDFFLAVCRSYVNGFVDVIEVCARICHETILCRSCASTSYSEVQVAIA